MRSPMRKLPHLLMILILLAMPFVEIGIVADTEETVHEPVGESGEASMEVADVSEDEQASSPQVVEEEKASEDEEQAEEKQTGAVQLTNKTDDGTPLQGTTYTLYKKATSEDSNVTTYTTGHGETIQVVEMEKNVTTNGEGQVKVDELPFGEYFFVETSVGEGVESNETFTQFKVSAAGSFDSSNNAIGTIEKVEVQNVTIKEEAAEQVEENTSDETSEDKSNESNEKSESKADQSDKKSEDEQDKSEEKTKDKQDKSEEKTKDKQGKSEEKTKDKQDKSEEKTKDKQDKSEEKTKDKQDKSEEKTEDKQDKSEEKTKDKQDKSEEKSEDNQDKSDEKSKDQTDEKSTNKKDKVKEKNDEKALEEVQKKEKVQTYQEGFFPIIPFVGDLGTDIDISPITDEILSGRKAKYLLTLKTTGPKSKYRNATITVDLPDSAEEYSSFDSSVIKLVEELKIAGVAPTYDAKNHQLVYDFANELRTGETYEAIITFDTKNGITPDGTELEAVATMKTHLRGDYDDGVEVFEESDSATVTIRASLQLAINKTFDHTFRSYNDIDEELTFATIDSETYWSIKASVPKKSYGQLYIDPKEPIILKDQFNHYLELPNNLDHLVVKGPKQTSVDESNNEILWEFDAPSITEQENKSNNLFKLDDINLKLLIPAVEGYAGEEATNEVELEVTTIDGKTHTVTDSSSEIIYDKPKATPANPFEGNIIVPGHLGPINGKGEILASGDERYNDHNPLVTEGDLLQFTHGIVGMHPMLYADLSPSDGDYFKTHYIIDENLDLVHLETPKGFIYNPTRDEKGQNISLPYQPEYTIEMKVNGSWRTAVAKPKNGTVYTREDLGLSVEDHVEEIVYHFTKMPAGTHHIGAASSHPKYFFTPKKGLTEETRVKNRFNTTVKNKKGIQLYHEKHPNSTPLVTDGNDVFDYYEYQSRGENNRWEDIANDVGATIIPLDQSEDDIVGRVAIDLLDHDKGRVTDGDNTLELTLHNDSVSNRNMEGPLETIALLPKGVTVKEEPKAIYTYGATRTPINGNFEILDDDYQGTGQQLIYVKWSRDQLEPNRALRAQLDVTIDEKKADSGLEFDIWGFTDNTILRAPNSERETITDTIDEIDSDDLNKNGDSTETRLRSGNAYMLKDHYNLISKKEVSTDGYHWSKLEKGIPGGEVHYKLTLNNTTYGDDIERLTLIDALPSIGDKAITKPDESRDSIFEPTLVGPIELDDRFAIEYSTAKDPKRKPLVDKTVYPDTTEQLDPEAGEETNWMPASEVTDWADIKSFKIELKEGEKLQADTIHEIYFTMKLPSVCEIDAELFDADAPAHERAAWNSFAVSTEHGQAVEPLRVGVYLDDPATGAIELKKVDEKGNPLAGAVFTLHEADTNHEIGEYTSDADGRIQVEGLEFGKYYFQEKKAPEGYAFDGNETYTFEITETAGFDDDANYCGPIETIEVENRPTDTPPGPEKTVEDQKDPYQLIDLDQEFTWEVTHTFDEDTSDYESVSFKDRLESILIINHVEIIDSDGRDVSSHGTLTIDDKTNLVIFDFDQQNGSFDYLSDQTYQMIIHTNIDPNVDKNILEEYVVAGGIPNEAQLIINDDPQVTNKVVVIPPPPVEKTVNGEKPSYALDELDEEFTWEVHYDFTEENMSQYDTISFSDQLESILEINDVAIVDAEGKDVSNNGTLDIDNRTNKVTFDLDKKDGSFEYLNGEKYTMIIHSNIKQDVDPEILEGYMKEYSGVPNKAELILDDEPKHSNTVKVIPPPPVEKTVNGEKPSYILDELNEKFTWEVHYDFTKEDMSIYETISFSDTLEDILEINGVDIIDSEGNNVIDHGSLSIENNTVTFDIDQKDGSYKYLNGNKYTMLIHSSIKADIDPEVLAEYIETDGGIPNKGTIILDDDPRHSNTVKVIPPPPVEKTVNGEKPSYELIDLDEKFTWEVHYDFTKEDMSQYDTIFFADTLESILEINDVDIVDSDGNDVSSHGNLSIDPATNTVTFELVKKDGSFEYLNGHKYTMIIHSNIQTNVDPDVLAEYIEIDGGVPNEASIILDDDPKYSNTVVVLPPPTEEPGVRKTVEDQTDPYELLDVNQEFTWEVHYNFGSDTSDWKAASFKDELVDILEIIDVEIIDRKGKDVLSNGTLAIDKKSNTVTFELDPKEGSFDYLTDQSYTMIIKSKIKDDVTEKELAPFVKTGIPNEADLIINDDPLTSNKVVVIPPSEDPKDPPKPDRPDSPDPKDPPKPDRPDSPDPKDPPKPDKPDKPDPNKPDDPVKPGQPGKPGDPEKPRTSTSGQPGDSANLDQPGMKVPQTGGLGTTLYTIIGALIIGLALYLYRRRRNKEQNVS